MGSATVPLLVDDSDDTIPFGEEFNTKTIPHPYVAFFHLVFRCSAIFIYLFCGLFTSSFITPFIIIVLLLSADFWTVKNITGRLLVGLRWWNYVDDEGASHWVYESKKGRINEQESKIFWLALILCPTVWGLLFMATLFGFSFRWLVLVIIALAFNASNLYGYVKCRFGATVDLNSAASDFMRKQIFQNAVGMISKPAQPPTSQPTGIV